MEAEKVISFINNKQKIQEADIKDIDSLIASYPYYQTGYILLTKGLQNSNSIRYNSVLRKTAAYCIDRKKLFKLITSNENKIEDKQKNLPPSAKEGLKIGEPLKFNKDENHSFSEWLTLLGTKKIERQEKNIDILVESFLKKDVRISKTEKKDFFKAPDAAKESLIENEDLVTPTLAKIYLEQKHYEKAILSYEKLILKYPKKSSFFAAQIELINKLNKT